jgi:hypothetical protein
MSLVIPEILYSNQMRSTDAHLEYQGTTEDPKYPLVNAIDWKDWTLFRVKEGTTDILFYLTAHTYMNIDSFGWFVKTLGDSDTGFSIRVYRQTSPGVFSPLINAIDPLVSPLGLVTFPQVTVPGDTPHLIRFIVPAGKSLYVRQVALGLVLNPPIGQQVGIAPPSLQQSWKLSNSMSVNGSLISRSLVRLVKEYNIDLEYLTPAFVNDLWKPFCTHALKYPFFFRWSPTNYPLDCMFAAANSVPAPEYQKPHLMRAKMPIMGLTQ